MKYIEESEGASGDLGIDLFDESLAFDTVKSETELYQGQNLSSLITQNHNQPQAAGLNIGNTAQKVQEPKPAQKLSLLQQTLQEQLVTVSLPSRSDGAIQQERVLDQELPKQQVQLSNLSVKKHSELAHHLKAPLSPPLTPPQKQQATLQIQNQPKINLVQQQSVLQPKTQKIIVQQVPQTVVQPQNSQPQQIIISAQPAPPPTLQTTLGQLNIQQLQQVGPVFCLLYYIVLSF